MHMRMDKHVYAYGMIQKHAIHRHTHTHTHTRSYLAIVRVSECLRLQSLYSFVDEVHLQPRGVDLTRIFSYIRT
jgi:hypothetical protein